jgi:3-phosphoshikimate 1-carboxyvinyltransferase
MIEIHPKKLTDCSISVPGSKSYTHRILIAAALSNGRCVLENTLRSEDTLLTMQALKQMGVPINPSDNRIEIQGVNGALKPSGKPIFLGNSGTSMRLLTAVATLGQGKYVLTGTERMAQRPIGDLIDGLTELGVYARSIKENGCPPVEIYGKPIKGGCIGLRCRTSSQFLTGLLLIGPYTREGLEIRITEGPVSKPYIDMTVEVMKRCGIPVEREGYERFRVPGGLSYKPGHYFVEPDCSQAGYFWGAAAITGGNVKVVGTTKKSRQGDVRFAEVLKQMGCTVREETDGIAVKGGPLKGVDVDMADMPDMVPTLAVVAAFSEGITHIVNVAHLRAKESDRLGAVANELTKIGIMAHCTDTGLTIKGGIPKGAEIETYNDHRIAMSFAMAGLRVPGIQIKNETCVQKSFPDYWKVFERLC